MKRYEIKTGDILITEDGTKLIALIGTHKGDIVIRDRGYVPLDTWDCNLKTTLSTRGRYYSQNIVEVRRTVFGGGWDFVDNPKYETIWARSNNIDIDIRINGKKASLSDISEETLLKLRNEN